MAIYKNTPPIVTNGLVLHLDAGSRMSYTSGSTTWRDLSGNANDGTLTNGPGFDSAQQGSIFFDGVNDFVTGSIPTLSSWTMTFWYKSYNISSAAVYYPFSCNAVVNVNQSSGIGFGGTFSSSTINRWYFYDSVYTFSNVNTSIVINQWYNLVVTKTGTSYNLYTNGVLSISGTGYNLNLTLYNLGRRGDAAWYVSGSIAQASIYNRALSQAEITQNYNALKSRFGLT